MADQLKKARSIFEKAMDLPDLVEQQAFVEQACEGDNDLLSVVHSLLNANRQGDGIPRRRGGPQVLRAPPALAHGAGIMQARSSGADAGPGASPDRSPS